MVAVRPRAHVCLSAVVALCLCAVGTAQLNTGNMRDLGYPEPNWYPIVQGNASAPAVVINPTTQVWGDIAPYTTGNSSLCKWSASQENAGRGSCKTDVSWIHSAVGLSKAVFDDPVVNYILRFQIEGACYRSTQYSDNDAAQYCAPWWLDQGTNTKINTTHICYEITQTVFDPLENANVLRKYGCAHKAPVEGANVFAPVTLAAPPAAPTAGVAASAGVNGTVAVNATAPPVAGAVATAPAAAPVAATPESGASPAAAGEETDPSDGDYDPTAPPTDSGDTTGNRKLLEATAAPATIPTAAAPPPPVAGAASPAPAGAVEPPAVFPTAADATNVNTTAAVEDGRAINTRTDFFQATTVYSPEGLEYFPSREAWYQCHQYTAPNTEGRNTCYMEAFGKNFGLNANILRQMVLLMQKDHPQCSANFAANAPTQGTISNQAWCEVNTAGWVQDNVLPLYDITGTPQAPQTLDPTITMPPPPPPPDPPLPSAPFAPPLGGTDAVDDVFATPRQTNGSSITSVTPSGSNAHSIAGGWKVAGATVAAAVLLSLVLL